MRYLMIALALAGLSPSPIMAASASPPKRVGECAMSKIKQISGRFSEKLIRHKNPDDGDGTVIGLVNNVYGISYRFVEEVYDSKVGDKVITCLVHIPSDCPEGDARGKYYTTTNLRTLSSWTLMDSQHGCGGA